MFELNETINWKPKSTGEGSFWKLIKMPMIGIYRFWGIPLPIWRTEDKQEEVLIGSIGELYNEIEKSIQAGFQKKNLLKDSKLEIWMKQL
jgi:isoleucyl-tRNA synthetase